MNLKSVPIIGHSGRCSGELGIQSKCNYWKELDYWSGLPRT